jgi:hypothetical protein
VGEEKEKGSVEGEKWRYCKLSKKHFSNVFFNTNNNMEVWV